MPDAFEKAPEVEHPPVTPETGARNEQAPAQEHAPAPEKTAEAQPAATVSPTAPAVPAEPVDPVLTGVENILVEDILDFYRTMPPELQQKFKAKGDETATKLRQMVSRATIKAKEVLKLIVNWLKLIPGINKFFLEQESKIKTDKIIELHKREHGGP